ncbi:MAG TPA: membrane protein insertase YidC [Actinomycetales bacterium]|nr:membrane protein insertase YidC [Actinomycetales bacterium]
MGKILYPLEYAVAWLMVMWHKVLSFVGMPEASGWTWALSIVGLVIVIRIILIPLFVKQIKASRGLQMIQPEMKKIQAKYKGKTDPESRQAMTQETMALYKETGTNPFASCLPIILQAPIFYALFRVLNQYVRNSRPIGPLTQRLAEQADNSTLFGAPLSSTFIHADNINTKVITVVLIVLMSATTFTTQRQLMMKNMPAAALDNPFAKQQKMLLYVLPVVFAVSGVNFPIGVLLYWLTTNAWSMGQQFYVIRRMPAPGSPAERALLERRRRHGRGGPDLEAIETEAATAPTSGQRAQPKRQARSKRGPKTETSGTPNVTDSADVAESASGPSLTKEGSTSPKPGARAQKQAPKKQPSTTQPAATKRSKQGKASATTSGSSTSSAASKKRTKQSPGTAKPGRRPR